MNAVIVDDEPLARTAVRILLEEDPEMTLAGEASGTDAVALIERVRPDIAFLDIQMPELDGFEVLARLDPNAMPVIVFVTAYDQYAVRAFEVHAVDYLLKPFTDARFARTLARAKEQVRARARGERDVRVAELVRSQTRYPRRFLVRSHDKSIVVQTADIDWIEAADYYVSLHVAGKTHLLRESIASLEQQLDPEHFVRVHRSAIVNIDRVREVHPLFRGDCTLVLADGSQVRLSRRRRDEFERCFALK